MKYLLVYRNLANSITLRYTAERFFLQTVGLGAIFVLMSLI